MTDNQPQNRVVITGIGIVSPLGLDTQTTWEGLINGRSGIDHISLFDASNLAVRFGGEVKDFDPANYISRKDIRRMDRFAQLAVAAGKQALENSGLGADESIRQDIGVIVGSGIGGLSVLFEQIKVFLEQGPDRVSPFLVPMMIADMAGAQVSIQLGLKGPNFCTTSACSSGSDAIGTAFEKIRFGSAKIILAGGAESIMNPVGFAGFSALKALSTRNEDPQTASRPFDANRDGFVIAEGAAILVLEEMESAKARGANIIAEIIGYGGSSDAFHITQPVESGVEAARAINIALNTAGIKPEAVDYINAHGTSTPLNDKMETNAIKVAFGEHARKLAISSTKSMLGHLIGGAGAIEASICALTIKNGIIPPTINYTTPDPDCDLDYTPNTARKAKVRVALNNSFGFGGHNSVLILREMGDENIG